MCNAHIYTFSCSLARSFRSFVQCSLFIHIYGQSAFLLQSERERASKHRFSVYLPDFEKPNGTFHGCVSSLFTRFSERTCCATLTNAVQHSRAFSSELSTRFLTEKRRTERSVICIELKKPLNLLTTEKCTRQNQSQKYVYI